MKLLRDTWLCKEMSEKLVLSEVINISSTISPLGVVAATTKIGGSEEESKIGKGGEEDVLKDM